MGAIKKVCYISIIALSAEAVIAKSFLDRYTVSDIHFKSDESSPVVNVVKANYLDPWLHGN